MPLLETECNSVGPLAHAPALLESPIGRRFPGVSSDVHAIRAEPPPAEADVVIVGGGPVGCGLACQLLAAGVVEREGLVVLDREDRLLARFARMTTATGQRVMRSPYQHQLAPEGTFQLREFARLHAYVLTDLERSQVRLALSGQRAIVPLDVFRAHSAHVLAVSRLAARSFRFDVSMLDRAPAGWRLSDRHRRTVIARTVILATGSTVRPAPWAAGESVACAYDAGRPFAASERIAVIGGGLTAGHLLMRIRAAGARAVWILRGDDHYRCADVPTAYFRTEGILRFQQLGRAARRRVLRAEMRGTLMPEMYPLLAGRDDDELVVHRHCTVTGVARTARGMTIRLHDGRTVRVNRVVFAGGERPRRRLSAGAALSDASLERADMAGVFEAGVAASSAIGPAARNLDGARLAAERILPALAAELRRPTRTLGGQAPRRPAISGGAGLHASSIAA